MKPGQRGAWMQTYTGRAFYPHDPRPEEISIFDIAHGLAAQCRYNGHTRRFYSVAEHSVYVSRSVDPRFAREALLHDAAEAYVGDLIRPLKTGLLGSYFSDVETLVELAVAGRFGLSWSHDAIAAVKEIDNRILVDERDQIMATPPRSWNLDGLAPVGVVIIGLEPVVAEALFLSRFADLFPEHVL